MHTFESLMKDLSKTNINRTGTLMVHSSMKEIGEVDGRADTVIDALMTFMADGLLVFPTHTWSEENLKDGVFDPDTEPACVGILPNIFRQREGVLRSLHPSHSVAAYGKDAKAYIRHDDTATTPCPRTGCFGNLYDREAQILFLGATLKTNTFIHSVEEWHQIEDRLKEEARPLKVLLPDGRTKQVDLIGHYNSRGDVSKNYDKLHEPMLELGIANEYRIGDAKSIVVEVKPMADLVGRLFQYDRDLFVDKRPIKKEWYL